jgi:hypothetical protein
VSGFAEQAHRGCHQHLAPPPRNTFELTCSGTIRHQTERPLMYVRLVPRSRRIRDNLDGNFRHPLLPNRSRIGVAIMDQLCW